MLEIQDTILVPELKVSSFQDSLDFYTTLAGFEVLYDRTEQDFAMLGINGMKLLMIEGLTDKSRTWKVGDLEKPFGRAMHLQIMVSDVQELYERFIKAGWPIFMDMEERWYRVKNQEVGHKQFLAQDPDGYLLRFVQNLGTRPFNNL